VVFEIAIAVFFVGSSLISQFQGKSESYMIRAQKELVTGEALAKRDCSEKLNIYEMNSSGFFTNRYLVICEVREKNGDTKRQEWKVSYSCSWSTCQSE